MDFRNMLKQAQEMQGNLQKEMEQLEVEGNAGGGMVSVRVNGKKELLSLTIDPGVWDEDDRELLQDLIIAAVNQAVRNVDEQMTSKIGSMAGHLNIPGLFK